MIKFSFSRNYLSNKVIIYFDNKVITLDNTSDKDFNLVIMATYRLFLNIVNLEFNPIILYLENIIFGDNMSFKNNINNDLQCKFTKNGYSQQFNTLIENKVYKFKLVNKDLLDEFTNKLSIYIDNVITNKINVNIVKFFKCYPNLEEINPGYFKIIE